jgi:hypothetical protein
MSLPFSLGPQPFLQYHQRIAKPKYEIHPTLRHHISAATWYSMDLGKNRLKKMDDFTLLP